MKAEHYCIMSSMLYLYPAVSLLDHQQLKWQRVCTMQLSNNSSEETGVIQALELEVFIRRLEYLASQWGQ